MVRKVNNINGNNIIDFYRAVGEYGFLSCLYKKPFYFEGRLFESGEHAYQYGKPRDQRVRDWMMNAPKPHLVSIIAHGLFKWDIVENWSEIRFDRMYNVLKAKFQDEELKQKLLETGDAILREVSKTDSVWGIGKKGNGKNMLGQLLMKVRKELKEA